MNQHDQMREALQALYDVQNGPPLEKYRHEWNLAMVLAEQALAAEPAPLVRLTDKEIDELFKSHIGKHVTEFSKAIMDAMIAKNGRDRV